MLRRRRPSSEADQDSDGDSRQQTPDLMEGNSGNPEVIKLEDWDRN